MRNRKQKSFPGGSGGQDKGTTKHGTEVVETRQYVAGTINFRGIDSLAVRDAEGTKVWVVIADFMHRHPDWICSHPRYFDIPDLQLATIENESGEVFLVDAGELSELLGVDLCNFTLITPAVACPTSPN